MSKTLAATVARRSSQFRRRSTASRIACLPSMKFSCRPLLVSLAGVLPLHSKAFTVARSNSRSFQTSKTTLQAASDGIEDPFVSWSFDEPCTTMELSPLCPATLSLGNAFLDNKENADLIILGVSTPKKEEDETKEEDNDDDATPVALEGIAKTIDDSLDGALTDLLTENKKGFGKVGSMTPTLRVPSSKQRYVVVSIGNAEDDDDDGFGDKLGAAVASKLASEKKVTTAHIVLPTNIKDSLSTFSTALYQNLHADNRFRTGKNIKKVAEDLESIELFLDGEPGAPETIQQGKDLALGILMAKDIVNAPHNVLNSVSLADTARKISEESPYLELEVLDKDECEKAGMGAFLGVARGSETEPKFIHITYKPPDGKINRKVGVIGKGLLFDTGGYNIKTKMMELM